MLTPYNGFPSVEYLEKLQEEGKVFIKPRRDSTGKEETLSRKNKAKKNRNRKKSNSKIKRNILCVSVLVD